MGIKIDIKANDLKTLLALLQQYLPNTLVWAFGSRVKFTSKPASDLDLVAFITEKQKMSFSLLKDSLAESTLPFRVDLHDWNDIPENFRKNIEGSYLVIQNIAKRELPSDWKTYTLGKDVVSKLGDGLHGTPIYDDNGEYFFINGSNLVAGKIVINSNTKKVSEEEFIKYKKELSERTILLGINGTIGNVALYNNEKCILGKSAAYLNINDDFDKNFVRYVLTNEHFQNYIKNNASGTTIKNVGLGLLREYEFLAPEDKTEQFKIAQILSSLDDKIELNLQMKQTLETMAQALFKEWFVDFKFPGFDGKLVDGLPKGWRIAKLSKVIDIKHGFAFKGEFFSDFEEDNILVTPGNFKIGGGFNSSKFKYYKGDIPNDYILERDDLIVTMTDLSKAGDTLGYSALVPTIEGKQLLHNQRIGKVIFRSELPLKYYLYLVMCQDNYRHFVLGGATGSTVKHTSPKRICDFEFLLPDKTTLLNFETIAKSLSDKQQENEVQINYLAQIRDALLPKLMSGQIEII